MDGAPGRIAWLALGDWGEDCEALVVLAGAMAKWAQQWKPDFVLCLGDNFCKYGRGRDRGDDETGYVNAIEDPSGVKNVFMENEAEHEKIMKQIFEDDEAAIPEAPPPPPLAAAKSTKDPKKGARKGGGRKKQHVSLAPGASFR